MVGPAGPAPAAEATGRKREFDEEGEVEFYTVKVPRTDGAYPHIVKLPGLGPATAPDVAMAPSSPKLKPFDPFLAGVQDVRPHLPAAFRNFHSFDGEMDDDTCDYPWRPLAELDTPDRMSPFSTPRGARGRA
jgi:hypothetical protein